MTPMRPSNSVRNTQIALRALSDVFSDIDSINPDGIFGPETARSVSQFQRRFNLPVTGQVDSETWNRIYSEYDRLAQQLQEAEPVHVAWNAPLAANVQNDAVLFVQMMLNQVAREFINFPLLTLTGIFDPPTEQAVRKFQNVIQQTESGTADRLFWNRLGRIYRWFPTKP